MVAGLVILWAVRLCERRSPSPLLGEWLWCKEPPGCRGPLPVYTTKFVSITSDGPPLSSGIGFALKCSSISKMLWNQRCWTRHWPSTLSASLRCCKNTSITLGYSRKNLHPHDGRHGFLTPASTWISKTAWALLPSGFPSSKTPPPIWISIKLLDTVILIYTQCRRILLGT